MSELIAWTDIQTNGVSILGYYETYPDCPELLEVGICVTDASPPFKFRGAVNQVIRPDDLTPDELFNTMSEDVFEIHEKSGLNEHYRSISAIMDSYSAEEDIIELLSRYGDKGDFIYAGDGRVWLQSFMPRLAEWYSDESIDLDAVRKFVSMTGVEVPDFGAAVSHRSVHDAHLYYEEFLYYVGLLGTASETVSG